MKKCKVVIVLFVALVFLQLCPAQQYMDDLVNGNAEQFYNKITLLGKNIKDEPYLSYYLDNAEKISVDVIQFLIQKGADPNRSSKELLPPLFYAIERGDNQIVTMLIDAKADVNIITEYEGKSMTVLLDEYHIEVEYVKGIEAKRLSPLSYAFYYEDSLAFEAFLRAGANPYAVLLQEKDPKTQKITNYTLVDTVFSYLEAIKDNGGISNNRFSCIAELWTFIQKLPKEKQLVPGYNNIFTSILKNDIKTFKGFAATLDDTKWLTLPALFAKAWDVFDFILAYNSATIDTPIIEYDYDYEKYYSPFVWTVVNNRPDLAIYLIQRGAAVPATIRVNKNNSYIEAYTLDLVARLGSLDVLKMALEKSPAEDRARAFLGCHKRPDIRQYLIDAGINPAQLLTTIKNSSGKEYYFSVLTDAAREGSLEAVKFYMAKGLPVVSTRTDEIPPLYAAIYSGNLELVKLLIDAGADYTVSMDAKMLQFYFTNTVIFYAKVTPLTFASAVRDGMYGTEKDRFKVIVQYLESIGAKW